MLMFVGAGAVISGLGLPHLARRQGLRRDLVEQIGGLALIGGVFLLGAALSIPL